MTKFEDLKFRGKDRILANAIFAVRSILEHSLDFERLSVLSVDRYLEILICDQEYNLKNHVFYDKRTGRKLSYNFMASIAHEYIVEHIEEFKKRQA